MSHEKERERESVGPDGPLTNNTRRRRFLDPCASLVSPYIYIHVFRLALRACPVYDHDPDGGRQSPPRQTTAARRRRGDDDTAPAPAPVPPPTSLRGALATLPRPRPRSHLDPDFHLDLPSSEPEPEPASGPYAQPQPQPHLYVYLYLYLYLYVYVYLYHPLGSLLAPPPAPTSRRPPPGKTTTASPDPRRSRRARRLDSLHALPARDSPTRRGCRHLSCTGGGVDDGPRGDTRSRIPRIRGFTGRWRRGRSCPLLPDRRSTPRYHPRLCCRVPARSATSRRCPSTGPRPRPGAQDRCRRGSGNPDHTIPQS